MDVHVPGAARTMGKMLFGVQHGLLLSSCRQVRGPARLCWDLCAFHSPPRQLSINWFPFTWWQAPSQWELGAGRQVALQNWLYPQCFLCGVVKPGQSFRCPPKFLKRLILFNEFKWSFQASLWLELDAFKIAHNYFQCKGNIKLKLIIKSHDLHFKCVEPMAYFY
jgi:hypothetical protein